MRVTLSRWHENAVAVERGPLTYALQVGAEWKKVENTRDPIRYGQWYFEATPTTPWNYGLLQTPDDKIAEAFVVSKSDSTPVFPWTPEAAPIRITAKARRLPQWQLDNESAGPLPFSVQYGQRASDDVEEVTLLPYGCTVLRIAEFPVVGSYSVD